jgi:hypothetical protein
MNVFYRTLTANIYNLKLDSIRIYYKLDFKNKNYYIYMIFQKETELSQDLLLTSSSPIQTTSDCILDGVHVIFDRCHA